VLDKLTPRPPHNRFAPLHCPAFDTETEPTDQTGMQIRGTWVYVLGQAVKIGIDGLCDKQLGCRGGIERNCKSFRNVLRQRP